MQHQTGIHTATTKRNPQARILSIGIVVAIHIAALWAILNGFMPAAFHKEGPGTIVPLPPIATAHRPLPPPTGTLIDPKTPTARAPDIQIAPQGNGGITIMRGDGDPTQGLLSPATSAQAIGPTHTIPPYPTMAVRLNEQGTVTLRLAIAADGSVTDASVQASSGSARLDEAAVVWVKAHWRYKPATRDGAAIASTTLAAVKFDLRNAH